MTNETIVDEMGDPLSNAIYNEGLEWAAAWIETYIPGAAPDVAEFARSVTESIRAAKKPADFQQTFIDGIRNDPYMLPENKKYWLSFADAPG